MLRLKMKLTQRKRVKKPNHSDSPSLTRNRSQRWKALKELMRKESEVRRYEIRNTNTR
jgi:hypothetical protein